jgi:hypothetical protein
LWHQPPNQGLLSLWPVPRGPLQVGRLFFARFGSFGGIVQYESNDDGALFPDRSGAFCAVLQRWSGTSPTPVAPAQPPATRDVGSNIERIAVNATNTVIKLQKDEEEHLNLQVSNVT